MNINYEKQVNDLNQPSIASVYGIDSQEEKNTAILNLLDTEYINKYNVNIDNLITQLGQYTNEIEVKVNRINKLKSDNNQVNAYSVYAEIVNTDNQEKTYELFIVKLDNVNSTFSVYPLDGEYESLDEITITNTTKYIERNNNNTYVNIDYNDSQIATKYFQEFKELMLENAEEAYNLLDEEYRSKRFGNVENFIQYVDDNRENIESSQIVQYQSKQYDDYKQYVSQNLDNTNWIIRETSPRNYKVILDTYTIDLPEFIEQYNNADDSEKVLMNIQRVFEAVNNKDYNYVYDKLDETFKQTNFPTLDSFEQYMENNYFDRNEVSYDKYQKSGNLYICEIQAKDANNENSNVVAKTFIMQLGEGTDFVMSFSV